MRPRATTCASRGFSLIELLVVVAVFLVISAIAIPSFLRARMSANESSAVASMHSVTKAQAMYIARNPDLGFSCSLPDLGPYGADFLDNVIGCSTTTCAVGGYKFTLACADSSAPVSKFTVNAVPKTSGQTGQRSFCTDESGALRFNASGGTCNDSSPAIQ